jgi:hypothetical protein
MVQIPAAARVTSLPQNVQMDSGDPQPPVSWHRSSFNGVKWPRHDAITRQPLLSLVRVQPVKFFSEWPKVEEFKSLTPLGESEKKPLCSGSSDFQKRASSREYGSNVYRFKT